jgi:single-stranded DNA-binding protein
MFGGLYGKVRGYVNHISERRTVGQNEVLDVLIGYTDPPRKGATEGEKKTVKASVWNYASSNGRDDIAQFLKYVKKGDQVTLAGKLDLNSYEKNGVPTSMIQMNVEEIEPQPRPNGGASNGNGNGHASEQHATAGVSGNGNGKASFDNAALDEIPF